MKRIIRIPAIILLCCSLMLSSFAFSMTNSLAKSRAKSAYAKILKSKKYNNDTTKFAVHDLNSDGVPELLIYTDSNFLEQTVYTCIGGKAKKVKSPTYPIYGGLHSSTGRGTYMFYRGGPADEAGIPFTMIEYKLKGKKIKQVNEFHGYTSGNEEYYMNNKKISKAKFNKIYNQFKKDVIYADNTTKNRKKYGVN